MKKKLAIIGNGIEKEVIRRIVSEKGLDNIVVLTPEEAKSIGSKNIEEASERYIDFEFSKPTDINIYGNKSFVCKGKHQYREVGNEWVCQCGRKL